MKRMLKILALYLCFVTALAPVVQANSGPTTWEGVSAAGMVVRGADCPIAVDHETLTFEISEFPESYYADKTAFLDYSASVTAAYTFRNPTDYEVTATLAFPLGVMPQYALGFSIDSEKYGVTVNGAAVETVLRHTLSFGSDGFSTDVDLPRLRDGWAEDAFYSPDLTVTKLTYRPVGVDWDNHEHPVAGLDLTCDPAVTKTLMEPCNGGETMDGFIRVCNILRQEETVDLYVMGELPREPLEWTMYEDLNYDTVIDGELELVGTETMTFRDLAMREYSEDYGVSESDWYNAVVDLMNQSEWGYGFLGLDVTFDVRGYLMPWLEYEIIVPAGETLENTVTAPLYPGIHTGYDPFIYTYTYLLTPASRWAEFGTLDIRIRTPHYLTESNLDGFTRTEEGYELSLEGLPQKDLEFVMSSEKDPRKPGENNQRLLLFAAAAVVLVVLVWRKRKRK